MEANRSSLHQKVLIIGGGIGGIKAALALSEARRDVLLIDKSPAIGGLHTQLDRTFPTNNCDICTLAPNLSASARQEHIDLMPLTQLTGVEGEAGSFTVSLTTSPRYIDTEKCTACGKCLDKFPKYIRFTPGLDHRAPTCMRYPNATPNSFSVKMDQCDDVDALLSICPANAIMREDEPVTRKQQVGSIIIAVGADTFSPEALDNYGYGKLPNVVTSLEYERIMSASGPTLGELQRPSDGRQPRKVAVYFGVSDTGIGIANDKLDQIFHRFFQVDGGTTRKYGGAGLGLAITQKLVDAMGGTIQVASQKGHGTTFRIRMSLDPVALPAAAG